MNFDISDADNYFSSRYGAQKWVELEEQEKLSAIQTAYESIKKLPFIGIKANVSQTDIFPRVYNDQLIDLPDDILKGIYEEAFAIISNQELFSTEIPSGVQSLSLGSASISFKDDSNGVSVSKNSMKFLSGWIKSGFDIESEKYREVY